MTGPLSKVVAMAEEAPHETNPDQREAPPSCQQLEGGQGKRPSVTSSKDSTTSRPAHELTCRSSSTSANSKRCRSSSASTKTSGSSDRLSTVLSDPRVLRATGVSAVLSRLGRYLRGRTELAAATFTQEESVLLWNKSWQVEEIDDFMSHCWSDAGVSKAVAIHLFYNGKVATLAALLVALVFMVLRWAGWLPTYVNEDYYGEGEHMYYAPWCLITGGITFFLTLAFGHRITDSSLLRRAWRRRTLFFDKICVHQSDPELKLLGVSNFAAIVTRSQRMLLLWSPTYFTRLWCTLECATLVRNAKRDDNGKTNLPLVFYPISMASKSVTLALVSYIGSILYSCGKVPGLQRFRLMNTAILVGLSFLLGPIYMHSLRWYMRHRKLLSKQLEEFSISNAGCVLEADRQMIYQTLHDWFGSPDAFSKVVQTTVRQHVTQAIGSEVKIPKSMMAMGILPFVLHHIDFVPIYAGIGGWRGAMLMLELPTFTLWGVAIVQQMHRISWWVAQQRQSRAADIAMSTAGGLAWASLAAIQLAPLGALNYLPQESTLWFVANIALFVFFASLVAVLHLASR